MSLPPWRPKLETLELGDPPCREITTGVTAKGLVVLAHHCPDLHIIGIHFQVASLSAPPTVFGTTPNAWSAAPRRDCDLRYLEVGEMPVPEESVLMVALTLALIFPRIEGIAHVDKNWDKVVNAICDSREFVEHSSEGPSYCAPKSNLVTPPQEPRSRAVVNLDTVLCNRAFTSLNHFTSALPDRSGSFFLT